MKNEISIIKFDKPIPIDILDDKKVQRELFGNFTKIDIIDKNKKLDEIILKGDKLKIYIGKKSILGRGEKSQDVSKAVENIAKNILSKINRNKNAYKKVNEIKSFEIPGIYLSDFIKDDLKERMRKSIVKDNCDITFVGLFAILQKKNSKSLKNDFIAFDHEPETIKDRILHVSTNVKGIDIDKIKKVVKGC